MVWKCRMSLSRSSFILYEFEKMIGDEFTQILKLALEYSEGEHL